MIIGFISGHLDLTQEEFNEHYAPQIDEAIDHGDFFIVGDAKGADSMAQQYILDKLGKESKRVHVYHMFDSPRNNKGNFITAGGFKSDDKRDSAMTMFSHYDIAWVRPGKENSGTAKNIQRRKSGNYDV
jgi:hypothetical protein